jgi:hypothetical protein
MITGTLGGLSRVIAPAASRTAEGDAHPVGRRCARTSVAHKAPRQRNRAQRPSEQPKTKRTPGEMKPWSLVCEDTLNSDSRRWGDEADGDET